LLVLLFKGETRGRVLANQINVNVNEMRWTRAEGIAWAARHTVTSLV